MTVTDLAIALPTELARVNSGEIELYCDDEACSGFRFFDCVTHSERMDPTGGVHRLFVGYRCRHCRKTTRQYAITAALEKDQTGTTTFTGIAFKFGELPAFGPHTPARMLRLIQGDRETFLLGRRAESQGMGIGAFAYYRRVVESQKQRFFDQIIEVAKRLKVPAGQIRELKTERDNWQFSNSIEALKPVVPEALLINGHNPLTLLHRALSAGLHAQTDAECLEIATSIRLVILELAERASQVMKEYAELDAAVSRLLAKESNKKRPSRK